MSYKLIYTVPFADIDNMACVVEIEKENYTGKSMELTAGSSPFKIDIEDSESLYAPSRFSTATIRVVGNDYLQSLFSTAYQQYRVTFKKNGVVTWCGFIKPEIYTQDYSSTTFELEIECISAMSSLEFIDYKQTEVNRVFISIWGLLKKCITTANGSYSAVYFPHVYAKDEASFLLNTNVLDQMTISEQNFFDEDDKPMKLKEVLEEICKLFQWTCVDWKGDLYFLDIDHTGNYNRYSSDLSRLIDMLSPIDVNIQRAGFAGSGHSLDVLPGYNKVTVKCSNYPIGSLIPDLFESTSLEPLIKNNPYYRKIDGDKFSYFVKFYTNPRFTNMYADKDSQKPIEVDVKPMEGSADNAIINNIGSLISKQAKYKWADGKPSSLSFENVLIIGMGLNNKNYSSLNDLTMFLIEEVPILQINPGYLTDTLISPSDDTAVSYLLLSGQFFQSDSLYTDPSKAADGGWYGTGYTGYFKLKIGDKYWDGNKWGDKEVIFYVRQKDKDGVGVWYKWNDFENNVTYDMNIDSTGYAIPIKKQDNLLGKIELTVLRPRPAGYGEGGRIKRFPYYVFMKDLKLQLYKGSPNPEGDSDNSDRLYENVINEDYTNELDEIELKISSYNDDGACYSKVLLGDNYLTDNLYSAIEDKTIRPEEQLIRRIIKRYSAPQIKLTQVIKAAAELTPITRLSDNYMVNKKFINAGGTIDYQMNQFTCIMIEV